MLVNKIFFNIFEERFDKVYLSYYNYINKAVRKMQKEEQNLFKVSKGVKINNVYNQVPHLTQDTIGKVTNSQLDTTNESQEVSLFPTLSSGVDQDR